MSTKQTLGFQAEVKQLLHLMIHSLYSNKEIFLRELISNASDAADKLRFSALSDSKLYEDVPDLFATVSFDKTARTITITDNGIGMNEQEVIDHLGTIAKSGTREFLAALSGDQAKDAKLIGQFGVGFYSSFIIADKVTVNTRKAGLPANEGVCWESSGEGEYTIEKTNKPTRGTEIILHLREGEDEFLEDWRLRSIITKYSDHINLPIEMKKIKEKEDEKEEWETVNRATALWTLSKNDIKDDEYKAFYKHVGHDFEDPLAWSHNKVEGKLEYISLLYLPSRAPFDLYQMETKHGLKLYVQRVFIMDDVEQFLPRYLRFTKGIVDSNDLPLNISREILQNNKHVDAIRTANTKKILGMIEKIAENKEKYSKFWNEFGRALKEGPAEDFANKEQVAKLLRFASTRHDTDAQIVSLDEYIANMKPDQKKIYYITADSFLAAKHSPHLEIFRKKGIEVLMLFDRIDEWLTAHLTEYQSHPLQAVTKGAIDFESEETEETKKAQEKTATELSDVVKKITEILGDKVKEVRLSKRLTKSPACIVSNEDEMSAHLQRMLKASGQPLIASKPILELNPDHPLIIRLKGITDEAQWKNWAYVLLDQAMLAEGGTLEDPAAFVGKVNDLLTSSA